MDAAALAMLTGSVAVLTWSVILGRTLAARLTGCERRRQFSLVMPLAALLTALGFTASAWAYAQGFGGLPYIDRDILTLTASIGRGALATAGILVLLHGTRDDA